MRVTIAALAATLAGFLTLAGCSPSAAEKPIADVAPTGSVQRTHPQSGLRVIPLTVKGAAGSHNFAVEVAESQVEQARGLMFRTAMGADEGMIFPLDPPRPASFWMKNTVIPLDIIFIGRDRRILNIAAETVPYSEEPRRSQGEAIAVLELNGGRAAELGIAAGDEVNWSRSIAQEGSR